MTQDQSPEFIETFKFLDRRLGDVATVGKGITEVGANAFLSERGHGFGRRMRCGCDQ